MKSFQTILDGLRKSHIRRARVIRNVALGAGTRTLTPEIAAHWVPDEERLFLGPPGSGREGLELEPTACEGEVRKLKLCGPEDKHWVSPKLTIVVESVGDAGELADLSSTLNNIRVSWIRAHTVDVESFAGPPVEVPGVTLPLSIRIDYNEKQLDFRVLLEFASESDGEGCLEYGGKKEAPAGLSASKDPDSSAGHPGNLAAGSVPTVPLDPDTLTIILAGLVSLDERQARELNGALAERLNDVFVR